MKARQTLTKSVREAIYGKCGGRCAYCGEEITLDKMQVDHVQPIHLGGSSELENLLPACRSCNYYKGGFTLEHFRERLESQPAVLMRDNVTYKIAVRFGTVVPNPHKIVFYFEQEEL